ncbi:MAG: ubiquinone biosynthesis protein COQ4 [Myxococcota bacterium]|jgi:ubiquinone biosynthesis protein COQ4
MMFNQAKTVVRRGINGVKLGRAFLRLVQDPERLDEVFDMADVLGRDPAVIDPIRNAFATTEHGARGLVEMPRMRADIPHLETLPEGTLGQEFAAFVRREGIDPSAMFRDRDVTDGDAWVLGHLLETHDVWHVVTGFGTDVAGELGLQAFYLSQFPARLASLLLASGLLNTFLLSFEERNQRMTEIAKGWSRGKAATPIIGVDWTQLWATPLAEVRERFGIVPADVPQLTAVAA